MSPRVVTASRRRVALAVSVVLLTAAAVCIVFLHEIASPHEWFTSPDAPLLPVIALASRQTRIDMWRHVQRTVDIAASRRVIADHMARCRANDKACIHPVITRNVSRSFIVYFSGGKSNVAAGHRRIFIALETTADRRRYCRGGAVMDFTLQSADDKVDVDFALEVDGAPGLYELQPYFRRAGRYRLCIDLTAMNPSYKWRPTLENFDAPAVANESRAWAATPSIAMYHQSDTPNAPQYCMFRWERLECFVVHVQCGDECVAAQRVLAERRRHGGLCSRAGAGTLGAAFKSGAWMRLASCDGNLCVGNLRDAFPPDDDGSPDNYSRRASVHKTKWWVFVSDTCTVRLYSRAEALRVLGGKWMMHWGDSTLQQSAIALLENMLGVPVFEEQGFMEHAPLLPMHRRMSSMAYRSFDRVVANSSAAAQFRSTLSWGGCESHLTMTPETCSVMGSEQRVWMRGILSGNFTARRDFPAMALPSVLLVNHYWWRHPLANESAFMRQLAGVLSWMEATVAATLTQLAIKATGNATAAFADVPSVAAQRPLLIWIGPSRRQSQSWNCFAEDETVFHRRMSWRIEAMVDRFRRGDLMNDNASSIPRPFRDIIFMARAELTSPLHVGPEYARGMHYSTGRGVCYVLFARDNHSLYCSHMIANITGDVMLNHWLLNAIDGSDRQAGETTTQTVESL